MFTGCPFAFTDAQICRSNAHSGSFEGLVSSSLRTVRYLIMCVLQKEDTMAMKAGTGTSSTRPPSQQEREELIIFEAAKTRIIRAWKAKLEKQRAGQFLPESPDHYLARKIYAHLSRMVQQYGGWRILERIVEQTRSLKTGRFPIKGKPFKLGLVAFLGSEEGISRNRRNEWGDAMRYAYIHGVEPRHYVGFIKQVGLKRVRAKLEGEETEPGFLKSQMRHCQ